MRRKDGVVQTYNVSQTERKAIVKEKLMEDVKVLQKEGRVRIPELGVFRIKTIAATKGGKKAINPFTKESYTTKAKPARKKIKFAAAKALKESL